MNARTLFLLASAAVVIPAIALAQKPPVKVEVIVDDSEEDEDFFDEDADKKDEGEVIGEVQTQDGVKIRTTRKKSRAKADNDNSATQVVNVIVQGNSQKQKAEAEPKTQSPVTTTVTTPATTTAPPAPAAAPAPVPVPAGPQIATSQPPAPPDCNCKVQRRRRHRRRWWVRQPNHLQRGDVMLAPTGGWSSAGGMGGLRLEAMPTNTLGIQFKLLLTGFDQDDLRDEDHDSFITNSYWGVDVDPRLVRDGFGHLTELGMAWHIFGKSRLDLHPTVGIAHFGYDVELRTGEPSLVGGSLLVKLGAGLNYHWRRVFIGVDFSWYPWEVLRYELVRNEDGDREAERRNIGDSFDERRFITTAHIGLRF